MKLTAKTIDTVQLPAGKSEHIVFDDEIAGFFVRVREGGSRTLGLQYKIGPKHRRLTLGPAVKEAFPDIRKRVLDLVAQVRLGQDPAGAKETSRQQAADTFEAISRRFLAEHRKSARPATYSETERYLLTVAKPLHSKLIAAVQRRDIAEVLSTAAAERGDVTANRVRAALSAMFTWTMREGLVESNPVIGTNKRNETPRERVLTVSDLVAIWNALDDDAFGDIVRLLMLTGQRRDEIGGLRWDEIDAGNSMVTLPKNRTKNGVEHIVPLSDQAREAIGRQHRIVGRACMFAVRNDHGFTMWGKKKAALDAKLPDLAPWTIHDIRRSVATGMADTGILPHVIEAVLNHVSGHKAGVAGIYNRATYLPEKTAALTLWAEHLTAAVSGKAAKVVPIKVA
jgi:integrase